MAGRIETEVLIVGAGPVGLFTALSLASRDVDVKIVAEEFRRATLLTGPVGGQSVNMGFREAAELSLRLTGILREAAPLGSLADYKTQSCAQWRQLLAVDGGLAPAEDAPDWARTRCSRILPCLPATGDDLSGLAAQIGLGVMPAAGPA